MWHELLMIFLGSVGLVTVSIVGATYLVKLFQNIAVRKLQYKYIKDSNDEHFAQNPEAEFGLDEEFSRHPLIHYHDDNPYLH